MWLLWIKEIQVISSPLLLKAVLNSLMEKGLEDRTSSLRSWNYKTLDVILRREILRRKEKSSFLDTWYYLLLRLGLGVSGL